MNFAAAALIIALINTGAFEYRERSVSSLFPGAHSVIETENAGVISLPSVYGSYKGGYLSGSGSNPYGIEGLTSAFVRTGYGTGKIAAGISWYRFGIDEYAENTITVYSGFSPGKYLALGAAVNRYSQEIATDELDYETSLYDWEVSASINAGSWISLHLWQNNLHAFKDTEREDLIFPESGGGLRISPFPGMALGVHLRRTYFGLDHYFSASVNLLKNFTIRGGYYPELMTTSASFSVMFGKFTADYCIRFHPHLGGTHVFGITASTGKAKVTPLVYKNRFASRPRPPAIERTDINICSDDEIRNIRSLTALHAERIIKYREIFGVITLRALRQIGMNSEEIRSLERYITEIDPVEKRENFRRKTERVSPAEQRRRDMKSLFDRLIAEGISPLKSMAFTQAAFSSDETALDRKLNADRTLTYEEKQRIQSLCRSYQ